MILNSVQAPDWRRGRDRQEKAGEKEKGIEKEERRLDKKSKESEKNHEGNFLNVALYWCRREAYLNCDFLCIPGCEEEQLKGKEWIQVKDKRLMGKLVIQEESEQASQRRKRVQRWWETWWLWEGRKEKHGDPEYRKTMRQRIAKFPLLLRELPRPKPA